MNDCKKDLYRTEVISLAGELVFVSYNEIIDAQMELLSEQLPDAVYMIRTTGNQEQFCRTIILNQN